MPKRIFDHMMHRFDARRAAVRVHNFQDFDPTRRSQKPHFAKLGFIQNRAHARLLSTTALLCSALLFTVVGCSVQDHKNGDAENVHLHTPVGGLDVRTNPAAGIDVGLPVYPGAVESSKHGDDSGSADIHMSFGKWRLHVKAIEYQSSDPEDKLIAFYKKAMASYGDVLTCKDKIAIGQPASTSQGLTCANDHEYDVTLEPKSADKHVNASQLSGDVKLLAGSPENQHIVEFTPVSQGTKFSVVELQLPHKHGTD
jgi:hypothetical protein